MFGSKELAMRGRSRSCERLTVALTPSSYQMLRASILIIASANASADSRAAQSQMQRGARRASTASDVGEELEDGIDCTAGTREVVSRDRNPAGAGDPVGKTLWIAGELVVGAGNDEHRDRDL